MENTDSTTCIKESVLIAQTKTYYEAPELRHLVNRRDTELDEKGNDIPLPQTPNIDRPTTRP